ncbi:MAG TPA: terminase [Syntrophus sp. (in: bacteria)]|jgi:hypothetical protein|nr:terminase [Syntrophus sp. (in: bacteria)]
MPARSKITLLPPEIKAKLDRLLIDRGFAGYDKIVGEINNVLDAEGYEIRLSRAGTHRYGQGFEERIAAIRIATEQARAITEAAGDDAGATGDALIRLVQEKAFQVLVKMADLDPEDVDFNKLTVAIAKLNNASVQQKKWQAEIKTKTVAAADSAVKVAKQGGLSDEKAEEIRKRILGIV